MLKCQGDLSCLKYKKLKLANDIRTNNPQGQHCSFKFSSIQFSPCCRLVPHLKSKSLSQVHTEVNLTLRVMSAGSMTNANHFVEWPFAGYSL